MRIGADWAKNCFSGLLALAALARIEARRQNEKARLSAKQIKALRDEGRRT